MLLLLLLLIVTIVSIVTIAKLFKCLNILKYKLRSVGASFTGFARDLSENPSDATELSTVNGFNRLFITDDNFNATDSGLIIINYGLHTTDGLNISDGLNTTDDGLNITEYPTESPSNSLAYMVFMSTFTLTGMPTDPIINSTLVAIGKV